MCCDVHHCVILLCAWLSHQWPLHRDGHGCSKVVVALAFLSWRGCCCSSFFVVVLLSPPPTGGAVILLHRVVLRSSIFRWAVLLWVALRSSPSLVWWCSSSSVVLVFRPSFWGAPRSPHPFGVLLGSPHRVLVGAPRCLPPPSLGWCCRFISLCLL